MGHSLSNTPNEGCKISQDEDKKREIQKENKTHVKGGKYIS